MVGAAFKPPFIGKAQHNKHNLVYFEENSMKNLFSALRIWQEKNKKRLLSVNIEKDRGKYCCIALTNPTEVILLDGRRYGGVDVVATRYGQALRVSSDD